jgi:hypothetical protein
VTKRALIDLGRVMPIQVNAITRTETKPVVRYETVAERRAAMIERGWPPTVLQAMEDALEPKFLQDLRAAKKAKAIEAVVVESDRRAVLGSYTAVATSARLSLLIRPDT